MKPTKTIQCTSTKETLGDAVRSLSQMYYLSPNVLQLGAMIGKPRKNQKKLNYSCVVNGTVDPGLFIQVETGRFTTARLYLAGGA